MNSSYVRKAQKQTTHTITPIGGEKELLQWRQLRTHQEAEYEKRMAPIRQEAIDRAKKHVANQDKELTFTEGEQAEVMYAKYRGGKLLTPSACTAPTLEAAKASPKPSKGLYDHFKSLCANVWRSAFDSER